jgi:tetratricopeptide (TPR) repeat protein
VIAHAGDVGMRAAAYGSPGFVYRQMGQLMKAKQSFETALQLATDRIRAMVGLGLIARDEGNLAEAVRRDSLAVTVQPSEVAYLLLAQALQRAGHPAEARSIYERRLRSSPDLPEAQKEAESLLSSK